MLGDLIILALLLTAVGLSIRSLYKSKKSGGGCCGDCSKCRGCPKE